MSGFKFKVGDIIRRKNLAFRYVVREIKLADETGYYLEQWHDEDRLCRFITEPYKNEHLWELAPHSFRVGNMIRMPNHSPVKILDVTTDYTDVVLTHSNGTELQYKIDNKDIKNFALCWPNSEAKKTAAPKFKVGDHIVGRAENRLTLVVALDDKHYTIKRMGDEFTFRNSISHVDSRYNLADIKKDCEPTPQNKPSTTETANNVATTPSLKTESVPIDEVFGEGDKVWLKINGSGPYVLVRLHSGLAPMRVPHHSTVDDIKAERAWIAQQVDGSLCYLWDSMLTKKEPPIKQSFTSRFIAGTVNWTCMLASLAGAASIGWLIRDAIN